ncbi:hypothetical protein DVH05_020674 [Phytophthora capsici]|nr:hypothetical protein DVH05_020674 [Phytophthora capsici]
MKLMSPEGAALALRSIGALDGTLMQQLLEAAVSRIDSENKVGEYDHDRKEVKLSLEFFRLACELLAKLQAGDSNVVVLFFKKYCPLLGEAEGNEAFIPFLTKIARVFDWSEIGEAMLASMEKQVDNYGRTDYPEGGLSSMEMALSVLDGLDEGTARKALLKMAVEKAVAMADSDLLALDSIGMLWKWVVRCEDKSLFDTIVKNFSDADTSLVGPSIQYFSQFLSEIGKEKRDDLTPIVVKRVTWLEDQINALDNKFTWEMPDARLPSTSVQLKSPRKKRRTRLRGSTIEESAKKEKDEVGDKIQAFLRGGEISMTTKGVTKFKELRDAQNFAARLRIGQDHCSFEMEVTAAGSEVLVTITKTRDWFLMQQKNLLRYQTELRLLKEKFKDDLDVSNGNKKRTRLNE